MKLLKIDEQGFFIEDVITDKIPQITVEDEEGNLSLINDPQYIEKPCPDGFYRPRWVGDWVEGLTQEEIESIRNVKEPVSETQKLWDMIDFVLKVNEIPYIKDEDTVPAEEEVTP